LPDQASLLLFALGRTIGWIAHAIEQYESGHLIRPRARYTGPSPHVATPIASSLSFLEP
jgi:citrate synthase